MARLPAGPLRQGFPNREVVVVFLLAKAAIVAAMFTAFYGFEWLHGVNLWNRHYSGADVLHAPYLPFANWDSQHYLLLAERGYPQGDYLGQPHHPSHAFFPLYPGALSAVSFILGDVYLSAFVLNLLLSFGFCYVFHRYASHFLPTADATRALALLLCWPTAFYLSVFYAEALLLFLLFGFLYYYDLRKSYLSLLFALLLPLARGQALFILAALVILLALRRLRGQPIDYRYETCNLAAFVAGGLLYLGVFLFATGDAFFGIEAQGIFVFDNALANIFNPWHFVTYLFSATQGVFSPTHALVDKLFIIGTLLGTAIVARSGNVTWLTLYFMSAYPPAAMGVGGSFSRFSLIAAPFLALAIWARYARHKRVIYGIAAIFVVLQVFFAGRFALNLWVA